VPGNTERPSPPGRSIHELLLVRLNQAARRAYPKGYGTAPKNLAMDDTYALAHGNLSILYLQQKEYDKAIAEGERALSLDQGSPFAAFMYAKALLYSGKAGRGHSTAGKSHQAQPSIPVAVSQRSRPRFPTYRSIGGGGRAVSKSRSSVPQTTFGCMLRWRESTSRWA